MQRTVRILLDDFSWLVNTSGAGQPQTKLPLKVDLTLGPKYVGRADQGLTEWNYWIK